MDAAMRRGAPWTLCGLLAAACLVMAWDLAGLDRPVMRLLGGPEGFAGRDLPALRALHELGRWLSGLALLLTAWACLAPECLGPGRGAAGLGRRDRLGWLAGTVLALLLVPGLKARSLTSCPWSLAEFGGTAGWVSHWAWGQADGGPGHCFPSGHAAGAFAFFAAAWAWGPQRPRRAALLLAGVLGVGTLFGLVQSLRGAHPPSHSLWSAWLCASLSWGVQALARTLGRRPPARDPAAACWAGVHDPGVAGPTAPAGRTAAPGTAVARTAAPGTAVARAAASLGHDAGAAGGGMGGPVRPVFPASEQAGLA